VAGQQGADRVQVAPLGGQPEADGPHPDGVHRVAPGLAPVAVPQYDRLRLVEPARLQQQAGLAQVDPAGVDPALDRGQVRAAGVAHGAQGRLQVALDHSDRAAVQGPAGGLQPAAGPLADLPHPLEELAAALRRQTPTCSSSRL
jgi:hypothetical protein